MVSTKGFSIETHAQLNQVIRRRMAFARVGVHLNLLRNHASLWAVCIVPHICISLSLSLSIKAQYIHTYIDMHM